MPITPTRYRVVVANTTRCFFFSNVFVERLPKTKIGRLCNTLSRCREKRALKADRYVYSYPVPTQHSSRTVTDLQQIVFIHMYIPKHTRRAIINAQMGLHIKRTTPANYSTQLTIIPAHLITSRRPTASQLAVSDVH